MRRKIDWLFLIKVNSMIELEFFMNQYPKTSSSYSNSNNCQICDQSDHKMSVLYPNCKCTDKCLTRYLFWKCKSTEQIVVKGINLHNSTTQNKEWKNKLSYRTFYMYFKKQWIDSPFCNWQLFNTPPSYSMSNCPIESYNGKIKTHFTDRTKFNLVPIFEILENVVKLESSDSVRVEIPELMLRDA
ncbi:hypothetical protein BpHYR1_035281 [Brachionus plicatilis]|uniref:Uncharacterized protein n=1 Tax=Brachionus plicatilis TaxID=10195 RepID=A0A3M7QSM5_BRAPC|nr:hypothetical protein BpHYR1_035281 [Brachionus plicatilis]